VEGLEFGTPSTEVFLLPALIVEADVSWRDYLLQKLSASGIQVQTALGASGAMEALSREDFSVALLDVQGLSPELLTQLERKKIPLVVLTHALAEDLGPLLARPGVYYLPKMASPRHLELLLAGLEVPPMYWQDAVA